MESDTKVAGTTAAAPSGDRDARATAVRSELRATFVADDRIQLDTARLLNEVREQKYWADWGFPSFNKYVESDCRFSYRKAQELLKIYRKLSLELGLTDDLIRKLEWSKAAVLVGVLTPANAADLLTRVDGLSFAEVRELVRGLTTPPAPAARIVSAVCPAAPTTAPAIPAIVVGDWRSTKPPMEEFYTSDANWETAHIAKAQGMNALLTGPSGCGKSELCGRIAAAFGTGFERFNCGAMTDYRATLIGSTHLDPKKGTFFSTSRFIKAITTPNTVVLLDELNRAPREALNLLLTLLDGQRYVSLDECESGAIVTQAEGVTFLATANFGAGYTGTDELDFAALNRWVVIEVDFPPPDVESGLLLRRFPGAETAGAKRLVRLAEQQRRMAAAGEFRMFVSTRMMLNAAQLLAGGARWEIATEAAVVKLFPADGGDVSERAKMRQLVQKLSARSK